MTELNCRLATEADLAALCQFYQDKCAHQKDDQFGADWHWGIYPREKDIAEAIAQKRAEVGIKDGKIEGYQIIIPTTWNLAPINESGEHGPMEQALIGNPVGDIEKPINALRTVHSFDPCTACAVHITEPATGKSFETVTSPWGVK